MTLGPRTRSRLVRWTLAACIVAGVAFRFRWAAWDEGASFHPDEYGLTGTLSNLGWPGSAREWFNTRISPLSPYPRYDREGNRTAAPAPDAGMRWGQWPLILVRGAGEGLNRLGFAKDRSFTEFHEIRLLGRHLSAAADLLVLLLLYRVGRRLAGRRTALLATALYALAALPVQQAHFLTVDPIASLFATAAVALAAIAGLPARSPGAVAARDLVLRSLAFGAVCGMAVASRLNLAPLLGLLPLAVLTSPAAANGGDPRIARLARTAGATLLAVASALVVFRVTQPMSFRAPYGDTGVSTWTLNPDWTHNVEAARAESGGDADGPPAEQWTSRTRLLFPFVNLALWGLGPFLGVAGFASLAWAARRLSKRDLPAARLLVPVLWAGGFFLFMGSRWVSSVRYFLPIVPWLALLGAWGVRRASRLGRRPASHRLLRALPGAAILATFAWAWAYTGVYRHPNTRIAASRWIFANVPTALNGSGTGLDGSFDERLPVPPVLKVSADAPFSVLVSARHTGTLDRVYPAHLSREAPGQGVRVTVLGGPDGKTVLGEGPLGSRLAVAWEREKTYEIRLTVPAGDAVLSASFLAGENWDEGLPASLDGVDAGLYRGRQMEIRGADSDRKRTEILRDAEEADYVVLSSQRALWATARLPNNYPFTLAFYRALFDGRLGYDPVPGSPFQAPLVFGPLRLSDAAGKAAIGADPVLPVVATSPVAAEEAFSVYDHPPVWIFRKSSRYDAAAASALFAPIDLSAVVSQTPRQAETAPGLLMMPPGRWARQTSGGTWSEMFDPAGLLNRRPAAAVAAWYLLFAAAGLLALPLSFVVFPGLPDRGLLLARALALLVVGWTAWILPALDLAPFGRLSIASGVFLLAILSGLALAGRRTEFERFVKTEWRTLAVGEVLFAALFVFGLAVRWMNPDLWHPWMGGEKPMAMANLNAILHSTSFPPHHPWFSGGFLNYYYFGAVLAAVPIRLLGIVPSTGYNLVLPTFFALAGCGAFTVASGLTGPKGRKAAPPGAGVRFSHRVLAGSAAVVLLLLVGNLGQVHVVQQALQRAGGSASPRGDAVATAWGALRVFGGETDLPASATALYWDATRIVPAVRNGEGNEITEFPFFTFLYGDLHPHFLALPLGLLGVAFALSLFRSQAALPLLAWLIGGLVLGGIRVTNPWDFPAQASLALAALAAACRGRAIAVRSALLLGSGFVLFRPFDAWYAAPYSSVSLSAGPFTPLAGTLLVHGLFLLVGGTFVLSEMRRSPGAERDAAEGAWTWEVRAAVAVFLAVESTLILSGVSPAWLLGPLLAGALLVLFRPGAREEPERRAVAALFAAGAGLALGAELVAIGADRMNTLFKFSFQAWMFFSVASGGAIAGFWRDRAELRRPARRAWIAAFSAALGAAALYPVTALPARLKDRFPGPDGSVPAGAARGLDGLAFTRWGAVREGEQVVPLRGDAAAIDWMNRNVRGTPVIVEAQTPEYHWGSRYSVYTGLPAVVGWSWHTRQHRAAVPGDLVVGRGEEVASFYATPSEEEASRFLRRYGVRYVVAGPLEALLSPAQGLAKLDRMAALGLLSVVYRADGVTLYEVPPGI